MFEHDSVSLEEYNVLALDLAVGVTLLVQELQYMKQLPDNVCHHKRA